MTSPPRDSETGAEPNLEVGVGGPARVPGESSLEDRDPIPAKTSSHGGGGDSDPASVGFHGLADAARRLRWLLDAELVFGWQPPIRVAAPPEEPKVVRGAGAALGSVPSTSERHGGRSALPSERTPPLARPSFTPRPTSDAAAELRPPTGTAPSGPKASADRPVRGLDAAASSESSSTGPQGEEAGAVRSGWSARTPEERARRNASLERLRIEAEACRACDLATGRTRVAFGVGDPCARLFLVGEAPGGEEDRRGEPFVGPAGQLLDDILRAMKLRREDVYLANVVKCRPPENRTPTPTETSTCAPFLRAQIDVVRPDIICALGGVAAHSLLGTSASVSSLRGRFHEFVGIPVRVTYHPAYLLREPSEKRKVWEDVQKIMAFLGVQR
jgi:uracil-DNA glycosylase family 4